MVYLSRIYTRTGDRGKTALGNGKRVNKDDPRIAAFGAVCELNSVLGLVLASRSRRAYMGILGTVQNELFDLGADLCLPQKPGEKAGDVLRVKPEQIDHLEGAIDKINSRLSPLRSFVLPGGQPLAAWIHFARAICRRAECQVVALSRREPVNPQVAIYLNRLSDLLFVMARDANLGRSDEILWVPGGKRREAAAPAKKSAARRPARKKAEPRPRVRNRGHSRTRS